MKKNKIVLIGSGNVAFHLALELQSKGFEIVQVFSRKKRRASKLASLVKSNPVTCLDKINKDADLYIVAIKDAALPEVARNLKLPGKLVVHTSGFHGMDILKGITDHYGVFYPLQTFSEKTDVDFSEMPVCIEAKCRNDETILRSVARRLSNNVRIINSEERRHIHLAAVFACNFVNYMYAVSEAILRKEKIPFSILFPLIRATAEKIEKMPPLTAQTGPASRGDVEVMEKHLKMIDSTEIRNLYKMISNQIIHMHNNKSSL